MQHARQVYAIWCCLTEQGQPFQVLSLLDMNIVKSRWLNAFVETWTPGTTKSYLGSLVSFLKFLLTQETDAPRDLALSCIENIRSIMGALRKRSLERRSQVNADTVGKWI